jgi:hypothetical protein
MVFDGKVKFGEDFLLRDLWRGNAKTTPDQDPEREVCKPSPMSIAGRCQFLGWLKA